MARLARYQYIEGRGKPHKISYWREDGSRAVKSAKSAYAESCDKKRAR